MEVSGLTVERIRKFEERHPEVRRATYRVPHRGFCGTAANYVSHLASRERRLGRAAAPVQRKQPPEPHATSVRFRHGT
jgi:hypothetical protein